MKEILHILLPNVSAKPNEIIDATVQTINMMVLSGVISLIFGLGGHFSERYIKKRLYLQYYG